MPTPNKKAITFSGLSQAAAEAKATAWLKSQIGLKNVKIRSMVMRVLTGEFAPKDEGNWTVTVEYEE
jgi:hypothetical protein